MEFELRGRALYGVGTIEPGDAAKLEHLLAARPARDPGDGEFLHLSGPGGDLPEAMALGRIIRKGEVETQIDRGAPCDGACAITFLAGLRTYATGIGVGRVIEAGATLRFQPLPAEADQAGRPLLGTVLDYAREMGGIDLGWLAAALTQAPGEATRVSRPQDILALKLSVPGLPDAAPADWFLHACRAVVAKHAPELGWSDRVVAQSTAVPSVKALRDLVVDTVTEKLPLKQSLARLNNGDALDAVMGNAFYLSSRAPLLDVRTVELERGGGFYFDTCVVVRSAHSLAVILLDKVGHRLAFEDHSDERAVLLMHDPAGPLW